MAGLQLIVGLGNPGLEYAQTRHNAGVWYVAALAEQYNIRMTPDSKYVGLVGRGQINGQEVRLLIPTTFMNRSGQSVSALANFFKIPSTEILVAHDELDLPVGTIRLKTGGGHGGHNGLRDIISSLGNQNNFHRLRIGIAHPGDAKLVSNYVLGKAPQAEQEKIESAIIAAVKVSDLMVNGNLAKAMNQLNGFKA
ncbi:MAG: aminoacyl-tRNA hydrolase [Moraxellaceae bacterium]|nr:aminoacyl-tRNA hydrolase [Moraxellaceae bacterium]MCP5176540.1 aminoacyl-tRNA hydrolase [Moraxellaceae bacterium]